MKKDFLNIDDIILSFLKEEISRNERKILQDWLAEDTIHKNHFKQIYKIWAANEMLNDKPKEVDEVLERIKLKIQIKSNRKKSTKTYRKLPIPNLMRWAAVIAISLVTGAFVYSVLMKESPVVAVNTKTYNEINVPLGSKSKIRLPDGTEVILNAGSKLTYNVDYGKKLREVEFYGEGYFKVAKIKDKPFIVHTSKANIRALGTEFNVRAYPSENIIETILVEGSVVVNKKRNEDKTGADIDKGIILKPGQKLQIVKTIDEKIEPIKTKPTIDPITIDEIAPINKIPEIRVVSSDVHIETSWKDKRWIIRGMQLDELAVLLSRKFNVNIHMKDKELNKYKFSGTITNETLEEVFEIMKYTIPISCKIDKGEATWSLNKRKEKVYKEAY